MSIICVDRPATFPIEIFKTIVEKKFLFDSYFEKIQETTDQKIKCALEHHYLYVDSELFELHDKIQSILENYMFEGFHNTRVIRKLDIKENGLLLLSPKLYFEKMRSVMTGLNIDESEQIKMCISLQKYLDSGQDTRVGMLSFFTPVSLSQEYGEFTKNIGGEICKFAMSDIHNKVYDKLLTNGYPVTVRFKYHFSDIVDYKKDIIAFEFIRHFAANLILGYDYPINFDAILTKAVEPNNIIEIIDFVDEWDCDYNFDAGGMK